jgi:hypothetical protein
MPIPRERRCQYKERRDANVEECDTEGAGMRILKESDADAERCDTEGAGMRIPRESDADAGEEQCRGRMLPGNEPYNSITINVTG